MGKFTSARSTEDFHWHSCLTIGSVSVIFRISPPAVLEQPSCCWGHLEVESNPLQSWRCQCVSKAGTCICIKHASIHIHHIHLHIYVLMYPLRWAGIWFFKCFSWLWVFLLSTSALALCIVSPLVPHCSAHKSWRQQWDEEGPGLRVTGLWPAVIPSPATLSLA